MGYSLAMEGSRLAPTSPQGQTLLPNTDRSGRGGLDAAASGHGIVPAFQPILALQDDGAVRGFEALARWPGLSDAHIGPDQVFARARQLGCAQQLDQQCARVELEAALAAGLPGRTLLTINYEPGTPYPGVLGAELRERARAELSVAFELTERSLLTHPHALLATVAAMRADGFLVALDDVGAHPDSLALLDVLQPDIVKLDMSLVQRAPQPAQAQAIAAVLAHQQRTDAVILAEGIETDEHLEYARALGATLGQGFKFGRPGPLDVNAPAPTDWVSVARSRGLSVAAPFDLVRHQGMTSRVGRKDIVIALSAHIEQQARVTADPPMVLTALQHDRYFTATTRATYLDLANSCPLVAIFGEGLPAQLGAGVRGVALDSTDPLSREWTVLALGPQLAVALIAREHPHPPDLAQADRPFDFVLTYDRDLVTDTAHNLLTRML
jgi:EAL domain-containing protein (putative c-di-GMP-specific phosphodiesterase class I)/DICT domain-containing protein